MEDIDLFHLFRSPPDGEIDFFFERGERDVLYSVFPFR